MNEPAEAERPQPVDPLRLATPRIDDVDARRARASVASKLFGGPKQPVRVGRYQVQGRIGTGGMGVVYRAHDPELARDVAVKVMNSESSGNAEAATARARLVREARAMARLAHPNVIHVYDVGTVDDDVFIAMELVEGESLATWLSCEPRDWLEVLRRYVDAGRGLSAAHAAGVVHRDFKPENVLVGHDGRVRVGDFGLAGAPSIGGAPSFDELRSSDAELVGESSMSGGALTRTGALLGTPKYMAPEQERGALASARSDQFSFCVALYEGLYGRPPFDGDTIARYRRNVRHGQVVAPPLDTKVKSWVHQEIVRGMAVDPAERHPGMDVLLDRLERALVDPRIARSWVRRFAVAGLVAAALGIGALAGMLGSDGDTTNDDGTSTIDDGAAMAVAAADERSDDAVAPLAAPPTRTETVAADTKAPAIALSKPPVDTAAVPRKAAIGSRGAAKNKGYCYWAEDEWDRISRSSRLLPHVRDGRGNCWGCADKVEPWRIASLSPTDDCSHHRVCVKESPELCEPRPRG